MPRSGTVYHRYLLSTYDGLLKGASGITPPVFGGNFNGTLGDDPLAVCHAVFPGFCEEYRGEHKALWESLEFKLGYDNGSGVINLDPDRYWPSRNPDVRIVYIVRKQADQIASYWSHCQNHIDQAHRDAHALGLSEFALRIGIPCYFKQKFTWDELAWRYAKQVMQLTYEGIMYERERALRRILEHFGHKPDELAVKEAIRLTSQESLEAYERETGKSLVPDQIGDHQTHFRTA